MLLFPEEAGISRGMLVDQFPVVVPDFPDLMWLVEFDGGCPADFQGSEGGEVNLFGVEAGSSSIRRKSHGEWNHVPILCRFMVLADW